MRVLHLNAGNLYGGVETFLVTLARCRGLCPAMESHFGICFSGRFHRELTSSGATVHQLGQVRLSRPWSVWRARTSLRTLLRKVQFDVAVCHMSWSQTVFGPVLRSAGVPLVHWAHGFTSGRQPLERLANRVHPQLVICNSRYTVQRTVGMFPGIPRRVVFYPLELPTRNTLEGIRARQDLNTLESEVVIIQVSRMEAWKGHSLHLQALGRLRQLPHWVCWMVGGAQRPAEELYKRQLEREAQKLGIGERVRFLGQRSDVKQLLAGANLFCQPNSAPEPFGLAFVEALSSELPVITTSLGGSPDLVTPDCGTTVAPGDSLALADELRRLIEDRSERERLGRNGPPRAQALCDPTRQLAEMADSFQGLLA